MAYNDFREYIDKLEEEGELIRIKQEIDWNLEMSAITRRSYDLKAPAPFFENIKDYDSSFRAMGAPAGVSSRPDRFYARLALTLGMDPGSTGTEIIEEYIKRRSKPIKPVMVDTGLCKENIDTGDDVNLLKFPIPYLHEGDGGRYIGTWANIITKDPDTGWVNWGMYRVMIHDEKTMGISILPHKHIGMMYYQKYEARDKPMEFAMVMGDDPVLSIVGCAFLPPQMSEVDVAGGLREKAVELIKCETVDLEVPASSEIVVEGIIPPKERMDEGPFGEYTGYVAGGVQPRPICKVTAVTYRNDPILPISCMGMPIDDCHAVMPVTIAAELLSDLRKQQLPVKDVYLPPEGFNHMAVVSTKVNPFSGYVQKLAHSIWASKAGTNLSYVIIVDGDVDVTNMEAVVHAMVAKCHPYKSIYRFKDSSCSPLMPWIRPEDRKKGIGGAYVLFDCTWPKELPPAAIPKKVTLDVAWPKEVYDKIVANWKDYGYE